VRKPQFTKHHWMLKEYMWDLIEEEDSFLQSTNPMQQSGLMETGFFTPAKCINGQVTEPDTKTQALFNTPTQLLVGAKCIVDHMDMTDFPLLSQLKIKFLTDFFLHALQREFDKLGNIIRSVDLANIVLTNDKEHARILVPK